MKIVKINDDLKINIEQLYSLERSSNIKDINEWNQNYDELYNNYLLDPPELYVNGKSFKPENNVEYDKALLESYNEELNNLIYSIIGNCPSYRESFSVILSSGLKINIDKHIYDKIDEYLEQYIDKET